MGINTSELMTFLVEAKKNTYAGEGKKVEPSRLASKDLPFCKGDYHYLDTYLGNVNFIGEEAVWHKDKPVWGMNYYGEMLIEEIPEGFSRFLKNALLNIPSETPFRGPEHYIYGSYEYQCDWTGDIKSFSGDEYIYRNGKLIYRLKFHGGYLR